MLCRAQFRAGVLRWQQSEGLWEHVPGGLGRSPSGVRVRHRGGHCSPARGVVSWVLVQQLNWQRWLQFWRPQVSGLLAPLVGGAPV